MERILLQGAPQNENAVLTYFEAEQYINNLKVFPIEEVASKKYCTTFTFFS